MKAFPMIARALASTLMHGMEHAAPSGARWQVGERFKDTSQPGPKCALGIVVTALRFHRPIDQERPTHNGITVDKSPVTAVLAMIAIVAHREILPWRDNKLVPLHVLANLPLPFIDRVGRHHLAPGGRKGVVEGISKHRSVMDSIGLVQALAIDKHVSLEDL